MLSYTGKGSGAAKLAAAAFAALKGEAVPVVGPEATHHVLPFVGGGGKAVVFGLGDPSDTLRLAEALKLMGYELLLVRPAARLLGALSKLEVYESLEVPPDPISSALEAGKFALELALEGSEGPRAERLREDLRDLRAELELPREFDVIVYTESMELAALALAEALRKPAVHAQHYYGGRALVLTTTTEEAWVRRLSLKNKLVSVPYDPLIAPLSLLASLKLTPYTEAGRG